MIPDPARATKLLLVPVVDESPQSEAETSVPRLSMWRAQSGWGCVEPVRGTGASVLLAVGEEGCVKYVRPSPKH